MTEVVIKDINTSIKYIHVEMVSDQGNKCDGYKIISGLLQGIKIKGNITFILLYGKKEVTNVINLKFYDIMTVEVLYTDRKDMTHFTIRNDDQKLALRMLIDVHKEILKSNIVHDNDEDLIDVSKYIDVPEDYCNDIIETTNLLNKSLYSGVGDFANTHVGHPTVLQTVLNKKKEIVPSIFGRVKSKKPSKDCLSLLQEKINQINDGKFKCILPEIPEDFNNRIKEKNRDTKNLYEENNQQWV